MENEIPNNIKNTIVDTIQKMMGFMNMDCQIELREEVDDRNLKSLSVLIYTPENARFIIGKNGENLRSLEQVIRAMFNKKSDEFGTIVIDINDYRKSKTNHLIDMAKQAVTRVRSTQKAEALSPMTAYERRVVHMELASYPDVATESIGSEPQRRIVIKPYP